MRKKKQYKIVNARVEEYSGGPDAAIIVADVELMHQTA